MIPPNERVANKILTIVSDMRLQPVDLSRVAFYCVQNARPHDETMIRLFMFDDYLRMHESNYWRYQQSDTLF